MTHALDLPVEPARRIVELADQCVKCGLCLPHCPSYRVRGEEGESPRGRIAYAKALATGMIGTEGAIAAHLDGCLACGACEIVCPSKVSYLPLVIASRARGARTKAAARAARALRTFARSRLVWRLLQRARGLGRLAPMLRRWPRAAAALASLRGLPEPHATPRSRRSIAASRGSVVLFRGCVASAVDADTHEAAARVLATLGYEIVVPDLPHCCGALAAHAGAVVESAQDAARARDVLARTDATIVVSSASGCARHVREAAAAAGLSASDVLELIARELDSGFKLRPVARRVALLLPCTQRDAGGDVALRSLLARIPALELHVLPLQPRCCGAAGTYFVEQPEVARALRDERLDQIAALAPDLVLTTNVGCRIHLQAGLRARGMSLAVAHPVTLIAEAMRP